MNDLVVLFKALSDETRLRILKLLEDGELCVCDIAAALGIVQPQVSFHLKILKDTRLLKDRRQGKWIHYKINDSDMFKRFLVLSVFEKIPADAVKGDQTRLAEFRKCKNGKCCA